ncbi:HWE histidine kinase domain-containing protein [Muricoccus vinaceus]|uniref:histidine kinase n=1 Tax=Muricoccus vinaceus TaxID=424704 RepID=A0ABV6IMP5_9PROT
MTGGEILSGYAPWAAAVTAVLGLGTYACLSLWDRHVRRDEAEALCVVTEKEAAACHAAQEAALSAKRHRALAEASAIVLWRAAPDGGFLELEGWTTLTGQSRESSLGSGWLDMLHPEDRERVRTLWAQCLAECRTMDMEYRLRTAGGDWRWCRSRGVPIGADAGPGPDPGTGGGRAEEWVGVLEDIDDRRRAEERRLLVAREVDHRAKNVLAVVQTIVRMSGADTVKAYSAIVQSRIGALARAHDLLAEGGWSGAELRKVAEWELLAYRGLNDGGPVALDGPHRPISALAVQPIAMVFHELATNAAKGGALSSPGGTVRLTWWEEEETLRMRWAEAGGPPVCGPPNRSGFGTRLIDATVQGQLGGRVVRHWEPAGLVVELSVPLARIVPPAPD